MCAQSSLRAALLHPGGPWHAPRLTHPLPCHHYPAQALHGLKHRPAAAWRSTMLAELATREQRLRAPGAGAGRGAEARMLQQASAWVAALQDA